MFIQFHHISTTFTILFLVLLFQLPTTGQSLARPERGGSNVDTAEVTEADRIDLRNGNLSVSIPLATLPRISGGNLGYTLHAHYNSKLWDSYLREEFIAGAPDYEETGPPVFYTAEVPRLSLGGGWRIGEKYDIFIEAASDDLVRSTARSSANDPDHGLLTNNSWHKTVLITPDGSRHELRPYGFPTFEGSNDFYRGYYKISPTLLGRPIDYYSFDGTFLRVRIYPIGEELSWRILQADGGMIEGFSNGRQRISDTNGNAILIFDEGSIRYFREERTGREIILQRSGFDSAEVRYRTVGGGWATVKISFGKSTVSKLFEIKVPSSDSNPNGACVIHEPITAEITTVEKIEFPATESGKDAPSYSFEYNNKKAVSDTYIPACGTGTVTQFGLTRGAGELNSMTTPLGATYRYSYHLDDWTKTGENTNTVLAANTVSGRVIETDVSRAVWGYSFGVGNSVVTPPDGTRSVIERYPSWLTSSGDSAEGLSGLVYRETTGNLLRIERRWKRLVFDGANDRSAEQLIVFNPVVSEEYKTIYSSEGDPVKTSATVFEHDLNGNILSSTAYDWFETALLERDSYGIPLWVPENARVLSKSENHFHHSPTAVDDEGIYHRNPSRVISTRIRSLSGSAVEEFAYDGFMYSAPPASGNLTAVRRWSDVDEDWLEEKMEYDGHGNMVRKTGPDGLVTDFSYMDEAKASPTSITRSNGDSSTGLTETFTFDFHTGHLVSAIDANGHRSFIDYHNPLLGDIDPLGRPGRELKPQITVAGGVMSQGIHYLYEDSLNRVTIESDVFSEGDRGRKVRQTKDQLGRTCLIERNATGLDGFAIESRIVYSTDGSTMLTENPRWRDRHSVTDGWTRISKDPLRRTVRISTFSGRKKPPFKGERDGWTGDITHKYDVDSVTIVDQAGKWTRRHSDALGRLTRVEEPGSEGNLPLSEVSTFYSYDLNGNLTLIEQGSDSRHFEYDSLLRLTGESSPESGQSRYRHDARGNRVERTDANGTITRYSYDWLGRLQGTEYAIQPDSQVAPTPAVRYHYDDVAVQNSKGRLTAIVSDAAVRYIESYDELGRITAERFLISGSEFRLGYEYTLGGQLSATILPSETRIVSEVNVTGDLESIDIHRDIDPRPISVASSIKYHPTGLVAELKHGNGLWESHGMNARLQPTSFLVGDIRHSRNVFSLENHFTKGARTHNSANNGNIHRQVVVHGDERVEHLFEYDSLNRLGRFHGVRNGRGVLQETYRYDRNGNLLSPCTESVVGEKCSGEITERKESRSTEVDTVRNAVGNLVQIEGIGRNVFDAENRLVRVEGRDGIGIASYSYDGEGRRVSKTGFLNDSPISTDIYIHDSAGRLVAEYSDSKTHSSVGRRLFLTSDHLDSVRLVTDLSGRVVSRHDYKPFGKEISRKTSSPGISRFAGHDKDDETGFYNAAARILSSSGKRFLSPDPITVSSDRLKDPQRLNRFSYVRNNPLRFSDPSGEDLYIKITNIVVGYQYLIDLSSGKRIRTEVLSYRVIVTNDSGTRRIFELTRGSSHGKRGQYGRLQEAPPGEYTGRIRQDGRRGFRVELTEPGQPDGQLTTPDAIRNRGNIQLHRNGLYVEGCMTFPVSDYDRFQETITGMIEQDRIGGFGSKIFVSVIPRNARDGATDLFPGDGRISEGDLLGDQEGRNSKTKAIFDRVIPSSPRRLQ